jgi:alpha-glucosidase (family GH31 glycosyl hydrolase)
MMHFLGSTARVHNIFNLLWAKTIFEGFSRLHPDRRVMNLTRSGFAGIQRYGVLPWSGDVGRSFGGLAVQLPMLLNMGMSGIAYHNSDIGGYSRVSTTPELYVRWMEYGTFCPIARAHGAGETVHGFPTEPWQFGLEAENICREYIRLRYRLLPYIYTMARQNYDAGVPLARPLCWVDPTDPALVNESGSYMWGDAFLVSPVVAAGQTVKEVFLPEGVWFNFWTDERMEGGKRVDVAAPLGRLPLFVRAGSIVPMSPVMRFVDEDPLDTLTLAIYPSDTGTSTASLYEDDGKSLGYQRGEYAWTRFTCRMLNTRRGPIGTISIGALQGNFAGKLEERTFVLEIHEVQSGPERLRCNGRSLAVRTRSVKNIESVEGYWYEEASRILRVLLRRNTGVECSVTLEAY